MSRFGIQVAAATRDLSIYKELAPGNLVYNFNDKSYQREESFKPIFNFSADRILTWLSHGFGDNEPNQSGYVIPCDVTQLIHQPDLETLSVITRAIHHKKIVAINYQDVTRGLTKREIIPFALADNGIRWHVRAFDRQDQEFTDIVLTRVTSATFAEGNILKNETKENDIQWNRIVELELVPHPINVLSSEAIESDYGMNNGMMSVLVRAALAGYALRRWNIDCSEKASSKGHEYLLWLRNRQTLYGVENLSIAPGYEVKTSRR
jgi:hypothetical protein